MELENGDVRYHGFTPQKRSKTARYDNTITMDPKINVAEQLRRKYLETLNNDLERSKLTKATLRLKPGVKLIFRPKRPEPYAAIEKKLID